LLDNRLHNADLKCSANLTTCIAYSLLCHAGTQRKDAFVCEAEWWQKCLHFCTYVCCYSTDRYTEVPLTTGECYVL